MWVHVCMSVSWWVGWIGRKEAVNGHAGLASILPSLLMYIGWLFHLLQFFLLGFGHTDGWARKPFPPPLWEAGSMEGEGEPAEGLFFPLPLEGGSCWDGEAAACRPFHIRLKNAGAACAGLCVCVCVWVGGAVLGGETVSLLAFFLSGPPPPN